jgi:hypothetical protein
MKRLFIFSVLILLSAVSASAQSTNIEVVEKGLFKNKVYVKCGIEMTPAQLVTLFQNDPNMKDYYKPIALNNVASTLLNSIGSALIFWPVAEWLSDNSNPNWNLAYIGAGCVVLSIPFKNAFNKHAGRAVRYYNSGYHKTSAVHINLNLDSNGLGLAMKF